MRAFKRYFWVIIVLLVGVGIGFYGDDIWSYLKGWQREDAIQNETPTPQAPQEQGRKLPSGFSSSGLKEKKVDLNNDGRDELLLTSYTSAGAQAVLVDPSDNSKALSNIFKFSSSGFSDAYAFKSGEAPELSQAIDLNKDGRDELVFDLMDGTGAYAIAMGVLKYDGKNLAWVMLEEKNGTMRPAIFRDGASVRNAEIFKIEEGANRYIADISGGSDNDGNWTWEVSAYKWNGTKYAYDASLSAQILAQQPKKIINGEPVF